MEDQRSNRSRAIILIVLLLFGGGALYWSQTKPSEPNPAPVAAVVPNPEPQPEDVAPKPQSPAAASVPDVAAPSFDIVRIEEDGAALVAGRAEPGEDVSLVVDGVVVAKGQADASGAFLILTELKPSTKSQSLSLETDGSDAPTDVPAAEVIVAQVIGADAPVLEDPLVAPVQDSIPNLSSKPASKPTSESNPGANPEAAVDVAGNAVTPKAAEPPKTTLPLTTQAAAQMLPQPQLAQVQTQLLSQAPDARSAPLRPATPAVVISDAAGVRLLQAPQAPGAGPKVMVNVALDSITYDVNGDVVLAGRSAADPANEPRNVRIYLDNRPIAEAPVAPDGHYSIDLPKVDVGVYTLRIDEVSKQGAVTSRVETPFKREDPKRLADLSNSKEAGVSQQVSTVQPGATLWAIARERYGEGTAYLKIFSANADIIRDPDLIYPGQVFDLPD